MQGVDSDVWQENSNDKNIKVVQDAFFEDALGFLKFIIFDTSLVFVQQSSNYPVQLDMQIFTRDTQSINIPPENNDYPNLWNEQRRI